MNPQQILLGAQESMTARRVFGEPIHVDGATIIPVARVGGGGGGGSKNAEEGGLGFGLGARPAGVYVVRNGKASWRPAVDVNRVILGGQAVAITALLVLRPVLLQWLNRRVER
jgi:uncharacterized spore protein YtfJ